MLTIPLSNGINQTFKVVLDNQLCKINIYENSTGLYLDLYKNAVLIRQSVLCLDRVQMITESYHNFSGRLMFEDTQGTQDPQLDGLGSRYQLRYLQPSIDF